MKLKPKYTATITGKYQFTIPKGVAVKLGLRRGDKMLFTVHEDGDVSFRTARSAVEELAGSLRTRPRGQETPGNPTGVGGGKG